MRLIVQDSDWYRHPCNHGSNNRFGDLREQTSALDCKLLRMYVGNKCHLYQWVQLSRLLRFETCLTPRPVMIALRIRYLDSMRASGAASKGSLHPVARVILESGAIYSSVLIALLGTFLADSWFQYVLVDSVRTFYLFEVPSMAV